MFEFKIPEVGENIKTGTVVNLFVKVGDAIKKDQDLLELETDKASIPVPSPVDGVVKEILIKTGDDVKIGQVIMKIDGAAIKETSAKASPAPKTEQKTEEKPKAQPAPSASTATAPSPVPTDVNVADIKLAVLGGGPGGYAAAFLAADLGMQVTLIDKDVNPGGVCLFRGCIPSKALLHAAKVISEARHAKSLGIEYGTPKIDLDKLRAWKTSVVTQLTGGLGQLSKQRKITYIQGTGTFVNSNTINVKKSDGKEEQLSFDKIILATGSRPIKLPFLPESKRVLDSTSALEIESIPKSLLLIGGGYIGLELGTVYAELGSEVSVVEMMPQLMTGADRDLATILEKRLKVIFKDIMVSTKVVAAQETQTGIKITFEDGSGKKTDKEFEKILVAVGRVPNSNGLGLENTKVVVNNKGFVEINGQRQTHDPSIFAIGDVAGNPMLAHKASHEGRVAVEAIAGHKVAFEPNAIPAVVFTDPEIAWAGLTETEAKAQGRAVEVAKFPWGASGRAITLDRVDGLTKLIIDPQTERILGVSIVGPHAGEMIAEGVLAIEMGAVVEDLKLSIHPHPTLTETLMEAAESFYGLSTHIYRPKKK